MSSAQNRPTGRQARTANTGTDDPRSAGAHSAGYQEGYPSETVDYGRGDSGQVHPSESAQYRRGSGYETAQYGREGRMMGATGTYPETGHQYGYERGGGMEHHGSGEQDHHQLRLGGALSTLTGLLTFFMGIVGILRHLFFATVAQYPFSFNARGRGTTELIIGAALTLLGVALLLGMRWARGLAIAVATLAAIANFMFLPFYPFWSIVLLALNVMIIWALLRHHGQQHGGIGSGMQHGGMGNPMEHELHGGQQHPW